MGTFAEALAPSEPLRPVPIVERASPDPDLARSWHLEAIGVARAWAVTRGERSIKIAVVDSGISYNHPELAAAVVRKSREYSELLTVTQFRVLGTGLTDFLIRLAQAPLCELPSIDILGLRQSCV